MWEQVVAFFVGIAIHLSTIMQNKILYALTAHKTLTNAGLNMFTGHIQSSRYINCFLSRNRGAMTLLQKFMPVKKITSKEPGGKSGVQPLFVKQKEPKPKLRFFFRGDGGIRTREPRRANAFRVFCGRNPLRNCRCR